ncbi:MAG: DUF5107 domain-containing protein [Bacteroidetes bacterium]|nr:DUF5107 domain-containing protein [Bacteroidota bacterium]
MKALVRKERIVLNTYPYSDPSPVPGFGRIYPYHRWDGYAFIGSPAEWEMVVLENAHIKVWVNPAAGGKVWGAVSKTTGREFIYFNHAAKFRDVAMRGPWTSGGIEFNTGLLGHSLTCATPVDYHTQENADGSVSCFVGTTDRSSDTRWWVEISLPADAAWFRTRTCWYNDSGQDTSYYSWTNAGIKASRGLEYVFPGHAYLGHDGKAHTWPLDEDGHDLSKYAHNDFGHYKSYHVIGSVSDFWGCYWHDDGFGMAHHSAYDQRPGKKIWIWGLSPYGMIWEDLLTDSDGQYSEVQSGRLFNQSVSASAATPFKHRTFLPCASDSWDEYWMPVEGLGGLSYASPQLSLFVGTDTLQLCANQPLDGILKLEDGHGQLAETPLRLATLQRMDLPLSAGHRLSTLKIWLDDRLIYDGCEVHHRLKRPLAIGEGYDFESVEGRYLQAREWERQRLTSRALTCYAACLLADPWYLRALVGMARVQQRRMDYEESLTFLSRALSIDTYDGEANYLYGVAHAWLGNPYDAKDGFSIAGQTTAYRSPAMTELGRLSMRQGQHTQALVYIREALAANPGNIGALRLQAVAMQKTGRASEARDLAAARLMTDPLDHTLRYISGDKEGLRIAGEWPHQTWLEIAAFYAGIEEWKEAAAVLQLSPEHPMVELWKAWIRYKTTGSIDTAALGKIDRWSPEEVFPHRREELTILQWAVKHSGSWKIKYFLSLQLIQLMQEEEARLLLAGCHDEPDWYPFYLIRAGISADGGADLRKAAEIAPHAWRPALRLSKYYGEKQQWPEAADAAEKAYLRDPGNYYLGLQLAACHMHNGRYQAAIALMRTLQVLPNEGASEGRNVWRETHLYAAIDALADQDYEKAMHHIEAARTWPSNIGVGKPYDVDERLEDLLAYYCEKGQGGTGDHFVESIIAFRYNHPHWPAGSGDLLSLIMLRRQDSGYEQARRTWLGDNNDGHTTQDPEPHHIPIAPDPEPHDIPTTRDPGDRDTHTTREPDPRDTLPIRWSRAFLDGDHTTLTRLAEEQPPPPQVLPYEIPYEDRAFPLIRKLYQKGLLTTHE